ncbi:KAP family P-loop NTPase fold protein [Photobacterium sanguinicancri]|uniref:KAP family P-loop NTPase fold protein n=1 Tax=Photobacterium sanguinicancri TaxID=875932 RepID=UPI003D0CCE05
MSDRVEFKWDDPLEITDKQNGDKLLEAFPEDKLDRVKYANFLTRFLADQGYTKETREKQNYVLNLNSEWGSGKTYFLRRWANDLKAHYPVVYVDAWKQDYSDDPLMTVISSMIKQLREQAGEDADNTVFKAPRKLVGLLKAAAPSVVGGLTKRYLGIDPVAIMNAADDGEVGEVLDENGEPLKDENGKPIDMGAAASKMVKHLIDEHDAKASTIESLKKNVEQWVEAVVGKDQEKKEGELKRTYPAFVFIDELDRCRPSYAVEMLETIKHIFNIPGVVFVVATDTEQLQHAVKAVYGEGFDARVYLGRFFNSRFSLKVPSFDNLLEVHCRKEMLEKAFFDNRDITVWPNSPDSSVSIKNITTVFNVFGLPARTAIQITERIIATLSNLERRKAVDLIMLATLHCLQEKDDELYDEIITGRFSRKIGEKNISLTEYLKSRFFFDDQVIIEFISPKEVTENLYVNNMRTQPNFYSNGTYICSFENYMKNIFSVVFGSSNYNLSAWLEGGNSANKTPAQEFQSRLNNMRSRNEYQKDRIDEEIGSKWLEYTNYKAFDKQTAAPLFYKDLVELASALDWIEEDK